MTDTEATSTEPDTTEAAAKVRIPNVRPGAVSGLDHQLLDPAAAADAEAQAEADTEPEPDEPAAADTGATGPLDSEGLVTNSTQSDAADGGAPGAGNSTDATGGEGQDQDQGNPDSGPA